jgi:hypothetical protein
MLPPNENEEAYFEGRDNGREDKESGRRKNLAKKYRGEKQCWYVQGYNDSYDTEWQLSIF